MFNLKLWREGRQVSKIIQDKRKRRTIKALEETADQLEIIGEEVSSVSRLFGLMIPSEVQKFANIWDNYKYSNIEPDKLSELDAIQYFEDIKWLESILENIKPKQS